MLCLQTQLIISPISTCLVGENHEVFTHGVQERGIRCKFVS